MGKDNKDPTNTLIHDRLHSNKHPIAFRTSKMSSLRKTLREIRMDGILYLMMVPGILYFIIFCYLPMYRISIAFMDFNVYKGFLGSKWVGVDNFVKLFSNIMFKRALRNTILISLYKLVFSFPVPILFAILLNEVRNNRFKKFVQTSVCLPHFISWVIVYGLMYALLSPNTGLIKQITLFMGKDTNIVNLMTSKAHFRSLLVLSSIWKGFGYGSIIYIATMTSIDPQLYEAAWMDGAGRLRQIWHITLPGIRSTIIIMLILQVGTILNAGFDQIFVLYNELVYEVSEIIDTLVYKMGMNQMKYSMATAAGLFKSLVGLGMVLLTNWCAKKVDNDSGLI